MADGWSKSQVDAWQYVRSAVDRGLSQTAALAEYRSGGGRIRDSYWGDIYKGATEAVYVAEFTARLPESWSPALSTIQQVDIGYSEHFQMHVKVTARDRDGNLYPDLWRIVQSPDMLTIGEWKSSAVAALQNDPTIPDIVDVFIEDFEFTERMD